MGHRFSFSFRFVSVFITKPTWIFLVFMFSHIFGPIFANLSASTKAWRRFGNSCICHFASNTVLSDFDQAFVSTRLWQLFSINISCATFIAKDDHSDKPVLILSWKKTQSNVISFLSQTWIETNLAVFKRKKKDAVIATRLLSFASHRTNFRRGDCPIMFLSRFVSPWGQNHRKTSSKKLGKMMNSLENGRKEQLISNPISTGDFEAAPPRTQTSHQILDTEPPIFYRFDELSMDRVRVLVSLEMVPWFLEWVLHGLRAQVQPSHHVIILVAFRISTLDWPTAFDVQTNF